MRLSTHKLCTPLVVLLAAFCCFSQETLELDQVDVSKRKLRLKKLGLYDGKEAQESSVRGFTQLVIFDGSLSDFWTSEGTECIDEKLLDSDGRRILNVKWNKDQEGCDWVGMGFGWDGWVAKDLGYVFDTLAVELTVRSTGEAFTNIPWAFCLEDYSGGQAWLGYNTGFLEAKSISREWTKVRIPLGMFPFEENEVDMGNIKQFMVQVFAEGEIEIASIALVPFAGKLKKSFVAKQQKITIDGQLTEWTEDFVAMGDHQFAVGYDPSFLYFAFNIKDETPRQNVQSAGNLWNGDAIEIAFSTNPNAESRTFLLLSDQHIGIHCGKSPYVWNWRTNEPLHGANCQIRDSEEGYRVELAIPLNAFRKFKLLPQSALDFEIAVDLGDGGTRKEQIRWNSVLKEGFHQSPSLWGELKIE